MRYASLWFEVCKNERYRKRNGTPVDGNPYWDAFTAFTAQAEKDGLKVRGMHSRRTLELLEEGVVVETYSWDEPL